MDSGSEEDTSARGIEGDPVLEYVPVYEGYKVLGSCVLREKLGRGGTSRVYLAKHLKLGIDVAVKCLLPERLFSGSEHRKRFHREAQIAASLNHENLVRLFEFDEGHGLRYVVLEYIEGETLKQRVERKGRLSCSEVVTIVLRIVRGLSAMHREGIVHRDVKPDNIMVSVRGEVKLTDLGTAKNTEAPGTLTLPCCAIGTPAYMSPEQWWDSSSVGPACDVWALGATLYYALTGHVALPGSVTQVASKVTLEPFPEVTMEIDEVPIGLVKIIEKCTRENSEERYADGEDLAAALENLKGTIDANTDLKDPGFTEERIHCGQSNRSPGEHTLERIRQLVAAGEGNTANSTVLVVDDDTRISRALAARLSSEGYSVLEAQDGLHGVSLAVQYKPDLVLMDISMPRGNGLEVAKRLLTLPDTAEIPVIFMTGTRDPEIQREAMDLGAAALLDKPFENKQVLEQVRCVLAGTVKTI